MGPTLRKRQLAELLQKLRHEAGAGMIRVQEELGCSRAKVTHLETGRNLPSKPDLELMLRLYGRLDLLGELETVRVAAHEQSWFDTYRLPRWMRGYIGLETDAVEARCFALELVPGLLQTEAYARDTLVRQGNSPEDVERGVRVRLERQRRLGGDLALSVVMSEALLARSVHIGSGVEQLRHLVTTYEEEPGVRVRVLPFSVGGHRSMSGSFTLLDFPPGVSARVAYQEYAIGGHLLDDQEAVGKLSALYEVLFQQSLSVGDSARLIERYAGGHQE
ncbi:MAG: helix-turn-helix domain-containing protein [Candidatus Dormibacteria bacterium]